MEKSHNVYRERKTFVDRVFEARAAKDTILCLGLDPQIKLIPPHILLAAVKEFGPTPQACAYVITSSFARSSLRSRSTVA